MDDRIIRVLSVEDNPEIASLIRKVLAEGKTNTFELEVVHRLSRGLERLSEERFDILLLDLILPDSQGLDTFIRVHTQAPQIPIIVLTSLDNELLAIEALKMGAQDYLVKGQFDILLLARFIRYGIERYENLEQLRRTEGALALSEARFRSMIEKDADGILIVDSNGVVRFVNPAAEVLFSCKAEEFLGRLFGFPVVSGETIELDIVRGEGEKKVAEMRVVEMDWEGDRAYLASLRDITERIQAEEERKKMILQLQDALEKVKQLRGLLPICAFCKKIRDDNGYWNQLETYIESHSEAEFTHGMCLECARKAYPQYYNDKDQEE